MMLLIRNMESNKILLIAKIKDAIKQLVYFSEELHRPNFSDQFKKVTGLTPFNFRLLMDKNCKKTVSG
jgi:hypothetical protein